MIPRIGKKFRTLSILINGLLVLSSCTKPKTEVRENSQKGGINATNFPEIPSKWNFHNYELRDGERRLSVEEITDTIRKHLGFEMPGDGNQSQCSGILHTDDFGESIQFVLTRQQGKEFLEYLRSTFTEGREGVTATETTQGEHVGFRGTLDSGRIEFSVAIHSGQIVYFNWEY